MNFFERIIAALQGTMDKPHAFGWFHFMFIAITLIACVLVCYFCRKANAKQCRIIVGVFTGIMLLFEIYKQLIVCYHASTDTWSYAWWAFPFSFCSTPIYVGLLAVCVKKRKFQNFLYSFLATFAVFGGLSVFMFPDGVFTSYIGLNIQTMVHHGCMIILGCFLLTSNHVKSKHSTILKGMSVFAVTVCIALLLNVIFHATGVDSTGNNIFDISPYNPSTLAVLSSIYPLVPYPVFLLIYVAGFSLIAYIILLISMLCKYLYHLGKRRKQKTIDAAITIDQPTHTTCSDSNQKEVDN